MKKSTFFLPLLLSLFLTACGQTPLMQSAGQTFDDVALTTKVKTEIAQVQGLTEAATINVDAYKGVVSLAGFVDSEQTKRVAGQAASNVQGVTRVVNNLIVKPKALSGQ